MQIALAWNQIERAHMYTACFTCQGHRIRHLRMMSVEVENGFTFNNDCGYLGVGRPGSIPFVSEKPGTYGRLLLAVYVRWKTGLLIYSDWLRPVTRGAWRVVLPDCVGEPGEPDPVHGPGETR